MHVTEYEPDEEPVDEPEYEDEFDDMAEEALVTEFHDTPQQEIDDLAREIEEAGDDVLASFDNESQLEDACQTLNNASEALQTVRDARQALRKSKGNKGRGKGGNKGYPSRDGKGAGSSSPQRLSIRDRKALSTCNVCGRMGPLARRPECPQITKGHRCA